MKQLFPIACLLLSLQGFSQYHKIDSLLFLIVEQSPDTMKLRVYHELSKAYSYINLDTCLYYGELSYQIATDNNLPKDQVKALMNIGYAQFDLGDVSKSPEYFERAFEIANSLQDTFLLATVSNGLGLIHWKLDQNEIAIKHLQNAYTWAQKSDNEHIYQCALNNLGVLNYSIGRDAEAIKYYQKVQTIYEKNNDYDGIARATLNIGAAWQNMEKHESSLLAFQQVIEMDAKISEKNILANAYINKAWVLNDLKQYEKSLEAVNKAIDVCNRFGYIEMRHNASVPRIKSMLQLAQYKEVIDEANKEMAAVQGTSYSYLTTNFQEALAQAYEGIGDYKQALYWQKKYSTLQDSLFEINRDKEIAQIEISYQTKQKEIENERLRSEQLAQEALLQHRTKVAIGSFLGLVLFSFVAVLLFRTRKKLEVANNHLEEKVKERTEALLQTNKLLQQSNEELKRFAFIASHDLKEPLRNTGGFISLMKKRLEQKDYAALHEYMYFIEKSNYQMVRLVNDILEYSRLESRQKVPNTWIDIQQEVKNTTELLSSMMIEKKAAVYCADMPKVFCNPSVMRVVLKNLIENGIKYNESPEPTVRVDFQKNSNRLDIIVEDNGIGIKEEYHHKVFEMFVRLHNRSQYSGTGMGLAFCKKMITKMGGDIRIESQENKGSRFVVSLACANS